jgi:SAM-dependent methyltransferase
VDNVSTQVWRRGNFLGEYDNRQLRPVEVVMFVRYRDELAGRVIELGSGAGRVTGYLGQIAREAHGIDISARMVEHASRKYPDITFHEGDLTDLSRFEAGWFDAVVAPCNTLDVLDDGERRAMLDELHRVIAPRGLLLMSSHNRAFVPRLRTPTHVRKRDPLRLVYDLLHLPRRVRNHRRLAPLEREEAHYQFVNDPVYDFTLMHYFISRDDQERQFAEHGFEMLEALDLEGRTIEPGESAPDHVELHYVARRT